MTDLRKLLIEARGLMRHKDSCEYGYDCNAHSCDCGYNEIYSRIDAALAEKVEPVGYEGVRLGKDGQLNHRTINYSKQVLIDMGYADSEIYPLSHAAPADQWRRVEDGLPDDVVGHKTFIENGQFRHEPLTRNEASALIQSIEAEEKKRNAAMPTEKSAIDALFDAYTRLKDFGWKHAEYCPKDGTLFNVLEIGSTGIHECQYRGEWPKGSYWIQDPELGPSPSHPVLFKPLPALPESDKCEHGKGLTDYCQPCGRING